MERKKFLLSECDIPKYWYNVIADMTNKPLPLINPGTKQPLKAEDLYPLFAKACADQEMNFTDRFIDIPDEVRDMYRIYRPTPLVRATGLEQALDTPAHIYFKNESVSPVGSHKLNSAIAQAFYCKAEGVTNVTFQQGDACHLDFPDETFDAVASNYVYHNVTGANKQELLRETLRTLKKGGTFAIHDIMSPQRYGDMGAFCASLRTEGYHHVRLIPTDDGLFMGKVEGTLLGLTGSTLLVGTK